MKYNVAPSKKNTDIHVQFVITHDTCIARSLLWVQWRFTVICLRMIQTCECFSSSSRSRQFSSRRRIFRRLLFPLFHMLRATRYRRRPSGTVKGFPWSSWASANEVRSYNFTMSSSTPTTMIHDEYNLFIIRSFDPLTYNCYKKWADQRILFE